MSLVFWLLILRSICGIENLSQQTSLQRLSTINMVFSDKDKILIRSLYLKGYTANRLTYEFPEKRWTKHGVNKLLKTLWDTGTVYRRPEIWFFLFSQGSVATCLRWGGRCHMGFVANFIRFPAVQKFWESVKMWQSYREFKGGNFFVTQCRLNTDQPQRRNHAVGWPGWPLLFHMNFFSL